MIETIVPVLIAGATGFSVLITRFHSRVHALDRRVDSIELKIAEDYLTKADFGTILERVESHMVRIENKLDKIIFK